MTDGIAGLVFLDDVIQLFKDKWKPGNISKPRFSKQWNLKAIGVGTKKYNEVIFSLDSEDPGIFSLMEGDATDRTKFTYQWLHDVSITIDVRTSESEDQVLRLVDECMRILKTNVVPLINGHDYIQLLPEGTTSMNEEYRNLYRYLISASALRLNP